MKMRMSTLLLSIVILQYFAEVLATKPGEGSSEGERRRRGRPLGSLTRRYSGQPLGRPRGTHLDQDQFRYENPNDGPPHRIVYYDGIEIKVWLDGSLVRKTICPANYIPQGGYYKYRNFLIRTLRRGDITLVAYISQDEKLIGVRPPASEGPRHNLEPTPLEWYINYGTTYLKVEITNSVPTGMSLRPRNVHVPTENLVCLETVAGITFRLFKDNCTLAITGVEFVSYTGIAP